MDHGKLFAAALLAGHLIVGLYNYALPRYRYRRAQNQFRNRPAVRRAKAIFNTLYTDINPFKISRDEQKRLGIENDSFTYGEICFYDFVKLLEQADPKPGENFYDLGAGSGKAVIIAALMFPFKQTTGIEKLPGIYDLACGIKNTATQYHTAPIDFKQQDIAETNFTDADIIFINSTCFFGTFWDNLIEKFAQLKPGTRIILTSKTLPQKHFTLITSGQYQMTWDKAFASIYRVNPTI